MAIQLQSFVLGVLGAFGTEILTAYQTYISGGRLPARYRQITFFIVRGIVAFLSGAVVASFELVSPAAAVFLGAAIPLVLQFVVRGVTPESDPRLFQERLARAEDAVRQQPKEILPIWDLSRLQLESYIQRNVSQVRQIF